MGQFLQNCFCLHSIVAHTFGDLPVNIFLDYINIAALLTLQDGAHSKPMKTVVIVGNFEFLFSNFACLYQ